MRVVTPAFSRSSAALRLCRRQDPHVFGVAVRRDARYARSAWSRRAPFVRHGSWKEHWRTRKADGLVGLTAETHELQRINLLDDDLEGCDESNWNEWHAARDPRALEVRFADSEKVRTWFSAVWAQPIPALSGELVGVLTVNTEPEKDGHRGGY